MVYLHNLINEMQVSHEVELDANIDSFPENSSYEPLRMFPSVMTFRGTVTHADGGK